MLIITSVGSRNTPSHILEEMEEIARVLTSLGHWLRSGHANGADYAFEKGARDRMILYLPWHGFNSQLPFLTKEVYVPKDEIIPSLDELVDDIHPNSIMLSRGARAMHRRNMCQVLGKDLDRPSDALICWAPIEGHGITGGTATAYNLALSRSIPVYNLAREFYDTEDRVALMMSTIRNLEFLKQEAEHDCSS